MKAKIEPIIDMSLLDESQKNLVAQLENGGIKLVYTATNMFAGSKELGLVFQYDRKQRDYFSLKTIEKLIALGATDMRIYRRIGKIEVYIIQEIK